MARLSTIPSYFAAALSNNNNTNKTPDAKTTASALQLPTPISSCPSDTSSCVENASSTTDESSQKPRATRRVTRASLRAGTVPPEDEEQSKDEGLGGDNSQEGPDEVSVGAEEDQSSRSSPAEQQGSDIGPPSGRPKQTTNSERRITRRSARFDVPKDAQPDSGPSSRRNSSKVQSEETKEEGTKPTKNKGDNQAATRRRSTRLTLLDKASEVVGNATTVLGKRSRDAMEKGRDKVKDLGKRASLRPRNVAGEAAPTLKAESEAPEAKKRRVSESDAVVTKTKAEEAAQKPKPPPRYKPKRWLAHGLYVGQDRNFDPRLSEAKNRVRNAKEKAIAPERKYLPLPMFGGERLLEQGRDFKLPFDIFSPLPTGQPKPDEWRKTNKNVFVGDAASIWKATKRHEVSTCMCTPETGCDDDCHNRFMLYECDDSNCRLDADTCKNRSFEGLRQRTKAGGKYNIGVEVIKTSDRGYGVRSNRTFEPHQIIVEYTGEILTQEEAENRMRKVYKNSECYYLMYFDQNMIIDATRGSMARFVNHSCEPNCRMEKWTVAGKPRMALFAGDRGIMTGEELTYDYNFDPFSQKNVQECRCGAEACRGVLGPRPKESRTKDESKNSSKPKAKTLTKQGPAGTKRKAESVLGNKPTSQLNKKRKVSVSSSIKAGVKKVVSKTTSRGRSTTTTTTTTGTKSKSKTATATTTKSRRKSAPAASGATKLNRPSKPIIHTSTRSARTKARSPAAIKRLMGASSGRASRKGK